MCMYFFSSYDRCLDRFKVRFLNTKKSWRIDSKRKLRLKNKLKIT